MSLATQNLNVTMGQVQSEKYPGFISLFHNISNKNPMNFSALIVTPRNPNRQNDENGASNYVRSFERFYVLDQDAEDGPAKLQSYAEAMAPGTYDEEPSVFMKHTLKLASELSLRKDVSNPKQAKI